MVSCFQVTSWVELRHRLLFQGIDTRIGETVLSCPVRRNRCLDGHESTRARTLQSSSESHSSKLPRLDLFSLLCFRARFPPGPPSPEECQPKLANLWSIILGVYSPKELLSMTTIGHAASSYMMTNGLKIYDLVVMAAVGRYHCGNGSLQIR